MKNSEKNARQKRTRIVYGVCVAVLVALSVIIAVTGAANRRDGKAHDGNGGSSESSSIELPSGKPEESESSGEKYPESSEYVPPKPSDTSSDDVDQIIDDKLPTFYSPVDGSLSKAYSAELPVYSLTLNEYRTHSGIDIASSVGAAVRAAADGVIGEVWYDPMMGWCVSVIHSGGAVSCYRNLANELADGITKDKAISRGDIIGAVGDTAMLEAADDAHLHFELAINGKTVDPLQYFDLSGENYEDQ